MTTEDLTEKYVHIIEEEASKGIPPKEVRQYLEKIIHEDVERENAECSE
jgi:hypothetical protein